MLLVFASTWAQIDRGIWAVVKDYYRSLYVWVDFQVFLPRDWNVPGGLPMPGGYLLGAMLLINLLAAHAVRFKLSWKRSGILLIHGSVVLFLVGEWVTGLYAVETQMPIYEGETVNWSQDIREVELAIVDRSAPDRDRVVAIPQAWLEGEGDRQPIITDARLPFTVKIDRYFRNSRVFRLPDDGSVHPLANAGLGRRFAVRGVGEASGVDGGAVNVPAVVVTFEAGGQSLGTYLLSPNFQDDDFKFTPQVVMTSDAPYEIYLRFRRYYKPYGMKLVDFRHDKYTGSEVAMNFSSDVELIDPTRGEQRPVKIYMNHPLRYQGETFFQADWIRPDRGTVLQVVGNPGWQIPYLAFGLASLGLLVHFGMMLIQFAVHRRPTATVASERPVDAGWVGQYLPWAATLFCLVFLILAARPERDDGPYALREYGALPVSYQGRVKPFDTIARNTLLILGGRQSVEHGDRRISAREWLLDVLSRREVAFEYEIFRIDHPQVLALFGWERTDQRRFSYNALHDHLPAFMEQAERVHQVPSRQRGSFDNEVLELANHLGIFRNLALHRDLYPVPPSAPDRDWSTIFDATHQAEQTGEYPALVQHYAVLHRSYGEQNAAAFNVELAQYRDYMVAHQPRAVSRANFESFFNDYAPFSLARVLYVFSGLLVLFSWLGLKRGSQEEAASDMSRGSRPLARAAFRILVITAVLHTGGLVARVYLSGRPPVTNLYSSAVFIGWGCVIFGLVLEYLYRNGLGSLLAAVAGFLTLLVAWSLEGDGDTMAVLQAVLDTNFWLATHVVVITLGYAATFVAGLIGIVYILRGILTRTLTKEAAKRLGQMLYGIIAFALVFSLVGTVLGGIWADQSWGRFWGWDPKENGALLIVLGNALIMHARWSGLVKTRGVAVLAVFGNIVTSWSWFGTNMLGVGLHAYGFIESAVFWLGIFIGSQLLLIGIGSLPLAWWRSFDALEVSSGVGPSSPRDRQSSRSLRVSPRP